MMTRSKLSQIAKWALAAALLYWAVSRGQIDWAVLARLFQHPLLLGALVLVVYFQLFSTFFRWKLLLHSQQIEIPMLEALKLGMASQFYQTLGPGTLGSDLARGLFISKYAPTKKVRGLSTVFLDRLMGFFGMLFLGAASFLFSLKHLEASSHKLMPALISLGFFLCGASLLVVVSLLFLPMMISFFFNAGENSFRGRLRKIDALRHVLDVLKLYSDRRDYVWYGIFISLTMHIITVGLQYNIAIKLFGGIAPLTLSEFFLGTSLGVLVIALPLAPSGIGVGQVAYSTIFLALGWPEASMGGSMVTALQVITIMINMSGFFFVGSGTKNEKLIGS
jgi:uncharacterized protein (TIRG00374 family)